MTDLTKRIEIRGRSYKSKSSAMRSARNTVGHRLCVEDPEFGNRWSATVRVTDTMVSVEETPEGWRPVFSFTLADVMVAVLGEDGLGTNVPYPDVCHWSDASHPVETTGPQEQPIETTPVCEGERARSLGGPSDMNSFENLLEDALLRTPHASRDRERLFRQCLTELDKIQTPDTHTIDGSRQAAALILAAGRKIEEDGRRFREFLETRIQAIVTRSVLAMHTTRHPQANTESR